MESTFRGDLIFFEHDKPVGSFVVNEGGVPFNLTGFSAELVVSDTAGVEVMTFPLVETGDGVLSINYSIDPNDENDPIYQFVPDICYFGQIYLRSVDNTNAGLGLYDVVEPDWSDYVFDSSDDLSDPTIHIVGWFGGTQKYSRTTVTPIPIHFRRGLRLLPQDVRYIPAAPPIIVYPPKPPEPEDPVWTTESPALYTYIGEIDYTGVYAGDPYCSAVSVDDGGNQYIYVGDHTNKIRQFAWGGGNLDDINLTADLVGIAEAGPGKPLVGDVPNSLYVSPDGETMLVGVSDFNNHGIAEFRLSTAHDINTLSFVRYWVPPEFDPVNKTWSPAESRARGIAVWDEGYSLWITDANANDSPDETYWYKFALPLPYSLSSPVLVEGPVFIGQFQRPGIAVVPGKDRAIYLNSPWIERLDFASDEAMAPINTPISQLNVTLPENGGVSVLYGLSFSPDGRYCFIADWPTNRVVQYRTDVP
jgi:hypothetical protein